MSSITAAKKLKKAVRKSTTYARRAAHAASRAQYRLNGTVATAAILTAVNDLEAVAVAFEAQMIAYKATL